MESFNFKIEKRIRLYFGKYKYRSAVRIPEVWIYKNLHYSETNKKFVLLNSYRNRWTLSITDEKIDKIVKFKEWLTGVSNNASNGEHKLSVRTDRVLFWSNDLDLIKDFNELGNNRTITQASVVKVNDDKGVIYLKCQPKFKHRVYFCFNYANRKQEEEFMGYLKTLAPRIQEGKIELSPTMKKAVFQTLGTPYLWGNHNHINYNDPGFSIILRLTYPDFIYRVLRLERLPAESATLDLDFESEEEKTEQR